LDTALTSGPVVLSLAHGPAGLQPEALVTTVDDASIVFGFTRSYFQVDVERPSAAVSFLHSLLPTKRIDELYTVIGHHRHGKREFYQTLHRALADPDATFEPVEGVRGLVMICFALRPMNAVFKVIRDRAVPPKQTTPKEVKAKYQFVFLTEHGGRLADTQEFAGLSLPKRAFAGPVEEELRREARDTVRDEGDHLAFAHLYTERRMTPLDVYLRTASRDAARAAVVDFGQAIKDLAGLNIFPGDMLAKNFGVTRHGRVIFYDYDEICRLTDCTFRSLPTARSYEDEVAGEPWFSVRDSDVFPEELEPFVRFPDPLHEAFLERHADLFLPAYWNDARGRVEAGVITEPPPYRPEHLLPA
jgi:isocitrate dehydrogenase kinase/phosphatase